jgi:RNA polymerase sigma-70 factor (ECF subfamily)
MPATAPARLPEAQHGDFEALYRGHYRLVVGFFRARGVGGEESRDLAQETFLRAYSGFDRFRGEASRKTWLLTIAANIFRNMLRERAAAKRDAQEVAVDLWAEVEGAVAEHELTPSGPESPLETTLEDERRRLLRGAVEGLPKQMRRCFCLYFYQHRKYREVADVLGVSIDTVKSQIYQAKAKLKRELRTRLEAGGGGEGGSTP